MNRSFWKSFPLLVLGWALALPAGAQTNFEVFNTSPTTVVPYGSPFTYSVAWTNGAYAGAAGGNSSGGTGVFIYYFTARGTTINVNSLYPPNGGFSYTVPNVGQTDSGTTFSINCNGGNLETTYGQMTLFVAPGISEQPTNANCVSGTPTTLGLSAGPSNSSFQWINAANGNSISSSILLIPNPTLNGALVYCRISNTYGEAISSNVLLNVGTPPSFFLPLPVTLNLAVGGGGTLAVTNQGTAPFSYQWFHNGHLVSGANLNYLTFNPAALTDAGIYSATVSNSFGMSNSPTFTVNVGIPPAITAQPMSLAVVQGQTASFSVTASGSPLAYQWKENNQPIFGATNATFNIANVQSFNAATYTCQVTNFLGTLTSTGAVLTVTAPPLITVFPASGTVALGTSLTESVTATGTGPLSYQWFFYGIALTGFTQSSFTITNAQAGNSGVYSVMVSNLVGSVTSPGASVTVQKLAPTITVQPLSQSVLVTSNVSLSVTANGSPALGYQWYQSQLTVAGATPTVTNGFMVEITVTNGGAGYLTTPDVQIIGGGGSGAAAAAAVSNGVVTTINVTSAGTGYTNLPAIVIDPPYAALNGQTNSILTVTNANTDDAANYFVVVTNTTGSVTSSNATLTVNVPIYITMQPQNQSTGQGGSASFSVGVGGSAPFAFQWYFLPTTNNNATATAEVVGGFVYGAEVTSPGGAYTSTPNVQILGGGGSGATATAEVNNGTVVAINITSAGSGYTEVPQIQIDPPLIEGLDAQTNAVLSLTPVTTDEAGNYFVIVSNGFASVSSTQATLLVGSQMAPFITNQPASEDVLVGANAAFTVGAGGVPTLAYQWQKNGSSLPTGTLPTYSITGASTNDTGSYLVIVTNNYGAVTSSIVTLLVGVPPQTLALTGQGGNGVQLQMSGTPNYPYVVQTATNLTPPVQWQSVLTNQADTNGLWQYSDTNLNQAQQFYRVETH